MDLRDDIPLRPEGDSRPPEPARSRRIGSPALVAITVVLAAAIAAFLFLRPKPEVSTDNQMAAAPPPAAAAPAAPSAPANRPLGGQARAVDVPPLGLTDAVVRQLLGQVSSRPELVAWLATPDVLRHGVAAVHNVANGKTPSVHFQAVKPRGALTTSAVGEDELVIDPRSYHRYDGIAGAMESLNAQGIADAYATLRPRLIEAYQELGVPDGNVDAAVIGAIAHLLQTPILKTEPAVYPSPVMYKYVDPRLENLSAAQKQLLRMGPRNVRIVQDKLREIAAALGVPDDQLPSEPPAIG